MHGAPSGEPGEYSPLKVFANIFIAFVGAGMLGLPYTYSMAGFLETSIILVLAGCACTKAMLMLVQCKYRIVDLCKADQKDRPDATETVRELATTQEHLLDYGDLAYGAFGKPGWWVVQVSIVLSQVGFCCAYLIFIKENLISIIPSMTATKALVGCLIPLMALVNIRDLSELGVFSLMADFANILAYCEVFFFDFSNIEAHGATGKASNLVGVPFALGIAIYCYEGAGMVLSLEASMPPEHRKSFPKIFASALFVITGLYIFFGASGYISFGDETEEIITLNLPQGLFPHVVKACLCFSLFFTFPVMMFPVSTMLDKQIAVAASRSKLEKLSLIAGTVLRCGEVALAGVIVTMIPDFASIMGLIGSTCCMLLALIMPGLIHSQLFKSELSASAKLLNHALVLIGLVGCLLGTNDALNRIRASGDEDVVQSAGALIETPPCAIGSDSHAC